jgi:cell division protein FtsW (lipid II flippase)
MILMTLLLIQRDLGMLAILTMTLYMVLFFITGQCRYLIASGPEIATTGIITDQCVVQVA